MGWFLWNAFNGEIFNYIELRNNDGKGIARDPVRHRK
jgi:asparagine synthetase B (glutamine-hydrolysing)